MSVWTTWISMHWRELLAGTRVPVPAWLGHPEGAGFRRIGWSTPAGQVADWGLSFTDGSRLHVHEFADGRLVAHRDKHDPDAGLEHRLRHFFEETEIGRAALVVGVIAGIVKLVESAGRS